MSDPSGSIWRINPQRAVLLDRPFLVAILNITPDSFSDGGRLMSVDRAVAHAKRATQDGADALDIGGESTRPGAGRVPIDEQIRRVVPVIEAIRQVGIELPISVDTTRSPVAAAALDAGGDVINDVSAGAEDPAIFTLASDRRCGLILMHRVRPPDQDQYSDQYDAAPINSPIVDRVIDGLAHARDTAIAAGVDPASIVLDPGLGFGKDVEQNLELIRASDRILSLGHPLMSALSRKSFVGRIGLGRDSQPAERLAPTLACSVLHLQAGARIFRVHDIAEHRWALDSAWALLSTPEAAKTSVQGP